MGHLQQVLQLLADNHWKIKLSKCAFAQDSIHYLGHVISAQGVATDETKIAAVRDWPTPVDAKQLRNFLGLAGYYRKYVRNYGSISKPLTQLLHKNTPFIWTSVSQTAFVTLKSALSSAPVLALPDFSSPFIVETDACDLGIGAVLLQKDHPIAFVSRALGPRNRGLSTYEKEYMAILLAVEHWRSYLQHSEFVIRTDHASLAHLTDQRLHTPWQHKVFTKLLGLQYTIVYKKGTENRVADALSRRPHTESELFALSSCQPVWLMTIIDAYQQDPTALELLQQLAIHPISEDGFTLQKGLIRKNGKIWIPAVVALQNAIIHELHPSPVAGHSGIPVTLRRLKQLFYWKGMSSSVHSFVRHCTVCQQAKPDRAKYPGLLQPLPVPDAAWQVVSMDFIEGLPKSGRYNCILVVVDKFSRYAHFIPLSHPFSAADVALAYMDNVFKLHSLPEQIISDRDRIFNSQFWRQMFTLTGTTLSMSSSYHPETDGQTERVNQCLEGYLRCFAHACPTKWIQWLSLAEFWYNTSMHSALGKSPFEVLYGHAPRHFGLTVDSACAVPDLQTWLQDRQLMQDLLRQHLERIRARMKHQADKRRTERSFAVGDMVFLKLQPYVQSSVAPRAHHKLLFKYYGPYAVLARVGEVAYKLNLPENSRIHPVVHVSQLKKAIGPNIQVQTVLPSPLDVLQVPTRVLQRRLRQQGPVSVSQVLVQWSGQPESLATWEDFDELKQRFPRSPAWGQAVAQGRGNVSTDPNDPKDPGPHTVAQRERRARRESQRYPASTWTR